MVDNIYLTNNLINLSCSLLWYHLASCYPWIKIKEWTELKSKYDGRLEVFTENKSREINTSIEE
uniref:Uncharacterized protein n=1 Tax=Rhizophora mucronata TaxID=61149 RepID=A0A2P2QZR1_RHIMU